MDANCLIFKLFGLFFANIIKTAAKLRLKIRKSKQLLTKITLFKKKQPFFNAQLLSMHNA